MKLILEIDDLSDVYTVMFDIDGLAVVREEIMGKWMSTIGYAVVIKNSNSGEVFYRKEFNAKIIFKGASVEIEKQSLIQATEDCNRELKLTIQKIQHEINQAKKRHAEFTNPVKLIKNGK